jgi:plasmid maintenance system antidote protein VapI
LTAVVRETTLTTKRKPAGVGEILIEEFMPACSAPVLILAEHPATP